MPKRKATGRLFRSAANKYYHRQAATAEQDRKRLIHEALRDLTGTEVIYAIRCPDGLIKVGHTADLASRRRAYGSDPSIVLAVRPGTLAEEQAIHVRLRPSVAHGQEYYHPTPEVLAFVNEIRTSCGVEPVAVP
ncbi:hypothetical protein O7626_00430 [Micromonospora sp. WMMD1102]|uniref:hypothetical protein n=1 Tax=Micromonospora sp. WMMD1102 TaxID=3016105 RepID=UPI00241515DD|nr:hypothetical protein [Micromonospora sp. WMMD1102]MDG4784339.1 hypothetical protein [Micromonospora sp. WMMD1102]MDG4784412.1 hypothetical protein [Micromonospora sp. WMMD1102]